MSSFVNIGGSVHLNKKYIVKLLSTTSENYNYNYDERVKYRRYVLEITYTDGTNASKYTREFGSEKECALLLKMITG